MFYYLFMLFLSNFFIYLILLKSILLVKHLMIWDINFIFINLILFICIYGLIFWDFRPLLIVTLIFYCQIDKIDVLEALQFIFVNQNFILWENLSDLINYYLIFFYQWNFYILYHYYVLMIREKLINVNLIFYLIIFIKFNVNRFIYNILVII